MGATQLTDHIKASQSHQDHASSGNSKHSLHSIASPASQHPQSPAHSSASQQPPNLFSMSTPAVGPAAALYTDEVP